MAFAPIAIVGRACVLPGALSPEALWSAVAEGRDLLSRAPDGAWGLSRGDILTDDPKDSRDRAWSDRGGYVTGFDEVFDPSGYEGLSADEARGLDPLFQWVLHTAREALRDAGVSPSANTVSAIFGNLGFPSASMARFAEQTWFSGTPVEGAVHGEPIDPRNRFMSGLPARLLAQALGLDDAWCLDAACASSLYAVKYACDALHDGRADTVLAGAVNKSDDLFIHVGFCALNALSKTGRSRPFDKGADGLVPGEGAGFLALRRLDDALRDGNTVHGVIRGVGLSNDGRGGGLLAPAVEGQVRALRRAYELAEIDPRQVSLVECHATGTVVGDGREVESMAQVYEGAPEVPVGSLKSNMGHLITAAGVAGIIKVLEAMRHETRPPTLHVDDPIDVLAQSVFRPVTAAEPWDVAERYAAVSAFGFGGNNAHVVLSAPDVAVQATETRPVLAPEIAVVGVGAVVARAEDRHAFADALFRGRDVMSEHDGRRVGRTETVELDLQGLKFPPNDLKQALGQQITLLQAAREATAGTSWERDTCGVYIGFSTDAEVCRYGARWRLGNWAQALDADESWLAEARDGVIPVLESAGVLGTMPNIPANRLNAQFDMRGPSHTVSIEERSGIVALELAVRALRAGELDTALVGAADMSVEPVHEAALRALDREVTPGDAAVALVLKRREDAEAAGDTIYAVLGEGEGDDLDADLVPRFGQSHAAAHLVELAAATLGVHHRARPDGAPWLSSSTRRLRVPGSGLTVGEGTSLPRQRGTPRLHVYAGADVEEVLAAMDADRTSSAGPARLVLVASDAAELERRKKRARRHLVDGAPAGRGVAFRSAPLDGQLAFVYTGAGAAYAGMGRDLLLALPELGDRVSRRFSGLSAAMAWVWEAGASPTVLDKLWGASGLCQIHHELSLAAGLMPDVAIGYSSGESNALFALGAWADLDEMVSDAETSGLFDVKLGGAFEAVRQAWGTDSVSWRVWTLFAPVEEVARAVEAQQGVHLSIIHADNDCIIAGEAAACDAVVDVIGRDRVFRLDYDLAVHVPELRQVEDAWRSLHHRPVTPVDGVSFYSAGAGGRYDIGDDACADAITAQACDTLDFRKVIEQAWADGVRVFVEHGPRDACARWIRQILGDRDAVVVSWDDKGAGVTPVFEALATLVAAGVPCEHQAISDRLTLPTGGEAGPKLTLDVHMPPLTIPAVASCAETSPAPIRDASEMPSPHVPVRNIAPEEVQIMTPAPWLPPITNEGREQMDENATQRQRVTRHEHATRESSLQAPYSAPTAQASHVTQGPSAGMHTTTPAAGMAGVFQQMKAYQAQLGQMHREFLDGQAQVHQQFLRMRQNALIGFTQGAGSWPVSPAPTAVPPPAATPAPATPPSPPKPVEQRRQARRTPAAPPEAQEAVAPRPILEQAPKPPEPSATNPDPAPQSADGPTGLQLDRAQLEIHASGRISEIYGPQFRAQDDYAVQVRMPEPPLLLADRVIGIDAEPGSMGKGTIWTETDVHEDSWYLNQGYMPAGVMIESGQADLMLISYLGIDFLNNHGERKYRLLGCELTYHNTLPSPGETLRYDIHCDGHANQGPVRLFFFHYDCRVNGELRLSVRGGQAGFFTEAELDDSAGILWKPETQELAPNPTLDAPAVALAAQQFSAKQIQAFSEGRPWDCFVDPGFLYTRTHNRTPKIQSGRMLFLDEITVFDREGGPWGRGYLKAETEISPDDWFFAGHFKNDPCMPGTLMFEGCLQAMAFYLTALGFTVDRDGWRFQPVTGEPFDLKCRGQVVPSSKLLTYEVFVEEVIAGPVPTLYADLLCVVDGLGAFHARRVGLQLVPDWPQTSRPGILANHSERTPLAEADGFEFGYASLMACAWDKPSLAFGKMYQRFDGHRRVARLPGPPYHFMSRVTHIDGEIGVCEPGAVIELEYDVPEDAWYFDENGSRTMPFAVLLEAALQPCGWLASGVGSALTVDEDLSFRNLDGTGDLKSELFCDAGTLRTRVKISNISRSAGMIIESFEVECFLGDRSVYTMNTVFGFFPKIALENQVGLPTTDDQRAMLSEPAETRIDLTRRPDKYCSGSLRVAQPMLLMLDRFSFWPEAGEAGLGQLRGEKDVDASEWFFKAHFFQDPVQPGSLGIEAMIQLLQLYMIETGMGEGIEGARFEPLAVGTPLTWKYRGQVVPKNQLIQSTMEITERGTDDEGNPYAIATASLWVDGKRIYEARNMGMRIVGTPAPEKPRTVLDPAKDPWIADHCPTWTVPALPMMSMVDLLAQHMDPAYGEVVRLTDIKVKRWLTVAQPRQVFTRQDGDLVTLYVEEEAGPTACASARIVCGEFDAPPHHLPPIEGQLQPDPYEAGRLFHGPAFQRLRSLVLGKDGSSAILDCAPTSVPLGRLHPVLLDAATHGIPHDRLHLWDDNIGEDQVAYPAFIQRLDLFGPMPTAGTVRCEVRYRGLFAPNMPRFEVQLIGRDHMWARFELVEACFPKGPLGLAEPQERRAFLRDNEFVPGLTLSRQNEGVTRLSADEVEATDWLPGTVQRLYGVREVAGIAVREHVGQEQGLHPGVVCDALPLTRFSYKVEADGADVIVRTVTEPKLDITPVKDFWTRWFDHAPWPTEDLYYGLIERFVRRVVIADPVAWNAIRGRSVLYLANHQTGVESLLFSVIASGLTEVPTLTLAKVEHQQTWLGRLIAHCFSYPGIADPEVITFFDRSDKESMPRIIGQLAEQMAGPGKGVMVHVEGTRSLSCRKPVEKMSGAFLDLAMKVGVPVVPVRFVGGLPAEPLEQRTEFPIGMGRQDIWFGTPILPEELAAMPYGDRKQLVVEAINSLGPDNAVEEALPGDPDFEASVQEWVDSRGVTQAHATLWRILEAREQVCDETRALLQAVRRRKALHVREDLDPWLAELAVWLGGELG